MAITKLDLTQELSLTDDFDLNSALQGNLVGYIDTDGKTHTGTLKKSVTSEEFSQYGAVYAVKDGEKEVLFDRQGKCVSPEYVGIAESERPTLKNVTATLPSFDTNKVTTRAGGETATINSVRPIDQFAIAIIQPILQRLPNPQEMSAADILKWSDVAYKWAQGMFSIASTYRTANDINANADSLKTAIENITKAINASNDDAKNLQSVIENIKDALNTSNIYARNNTYDIANLKTAVDSISTAISQQETKFPDTMSVKLSDTVKVDNPADDKFDVNGAGGLSYEELLDIGENITDIPSFNGKAIGRATIANFAKKVFALDTVLAWLRKDENKEADIWNNHAAAIYNAVKSAVSDAIDEKIKAFADLNSLKTSQSQ